MEEENEVKEECALILLDDAGIASPQLIGKYDSWKAARKAGRNYVSDKNGQGGACWVQIFHTLWADFADVDGKRLRLSVCLAKDAPSYLDH